jgi:hypothetical protein
MMYPNVIIGMNCVYFIKSINEPIYLINFIEKIDSDEESFDVISRWENVGDNLLKKTIHLDAKDVSNQKVLQKVLYIKNSLLSNINFCKNLYAESTGLDCGPVNDLSIYKKKPGQSGINFKKEKVKDLVNVYVILNSDPDHIPFCVDKDKNLYLRPESASMLMIPDDLDQMVGQNPSSITYYAKASFPINTRKNYPSEYKIN